MNLKIGQPSPEPGLPYVLIPGHPVLVLLLLQTLEVEPTVEPGEFQLKLSLNPGVDHVHLQNVQEGHGQANSVHLKVSYNTTIYYHIKK